MQIPRYEPSVGVPSAPNVKVSQPVSPEAFGSDIGDAIQRAGHKLAVVAARQQEENDRIQLSLMDAQHEAFVNDFLVKEQTNPDYEGTVSRFQEANAAYLKQTLEAVPQRLRGYVGPMMQAKSLSYEAKAKGIFLEKQQKAGIATTMSALDTYVKNNDFEGYERELNSNGYLDPMQKEKLRQSGLKSIDLNKIAAILDADPYAELNKEDYKSMDDSTWDAVQKDQRAAQNLDKQAFKEKQEAERERLIGVIREKKAPISSLRTMVQGSILDNSDKEQLDDFIDSEHGISHSRSGGGGGGSSSGGSGGGRSYKNNPDTLNAIYDLIDANKLIEKFPTFKDFRDGTKGNLTVSKQEEFMKYYKGEGDDVPRLLTASKVVGSVIKGHKDIFGQGDVPKDQQLAEREHFNEDFYSQLKILEKGLGRKATDGEMVKLGQTLMADRIIVKGGFLGYGEKKLHGYQIPDNVVQIGKGYYVKPDGVVYNRSIQKWVLPPNGKDRLKPSVWTPDEGDLYRP